MNPIIDHPYFENIDFTAQLSKLSSNFIFNFHRKVVKKLAGLNTRIL